MAKEQQSRKVNHLINVIVDWRIMRTPSKRERQVKLKALASAKARRTGFRCFWTWTYSNSWGNSYSENRFAKLGIWRIHRLVFTNLKNY